MHGRCRPRRIALWHKRGVCRAQEVNRPSRLGFRVACMAFSRRVPSPLRTCSCMAWRGHSQIKSFFQVSKHYPVQVYATAAQG